MEYLLDLIDKARHVLDELETSQPIPQILQVRDATGLSLGESKDLYDALGDCKTRGITGADASEFMLGYYLGRQFVRLGETSTITRGFHVALR